MLVVKNPTARAGDARGTGSISRSERSAGVPNGLSAHTMHKGFNFDVVQFIWLLSLLVLLMSSWLSHRRVGSQSSLDEPRRFQSSGDFKRSGCCGRYWWKRNKSYNLSLKSVFCAYLTWIPFTLPCNLINPCCWLWRKALGNFLGKVVDPMEV